MKKIFFLFYLIQAFAFAEICYFIPPKGWEAAQMKNPSPHIKVGFIGKGSTEFRPSMNLATEEVDVSLNEYVKSVKELHLQDAGTKLRDFGKLKTRGGTARLLEITNGSPFGELKILQTILVKKQTAYILTAAVLKKEFAEFQNELLTSLKSLDVTKNFWVPFKEKETKNKIESIFANLGNGEDPDKEWDRFHKQILQIDTLGPYWQYLALDEGRKKIYKP